MSAEQTLFLNVLEVALKEKEAPEWLESRDGRLVCLLAGLEHEYVRRMFGERRWCVFKGCWVR